MLPPRPHLLPGAQRFVDSLEDDLRAHGALVVRSPDSTTHELIGSLSESRLGSSSRFVRTSADVLMSQGKPLRELAACVEVPPAADIQQLVRHPELDPTVVLVDGWATKSWDRARWWRFVESVAAANRGLGERRRLTLVVGVPSDGLEWQPDPNRTTAERWWWGVFDRTDARIAVALAAEVSDLVAECAIELAGFDIGLAVAIAHACPSGHIDVTVAKEFIERSTGQRRFAAPATATNAFRPHTESIDGWAEGLIEFWDGREALHPEAEEAADWDRYLTRRLWRGQCRALFSTLEDLRAEVAHWMERHEAEIDPDELDLAFEEDRRASRISELSSGALCTLTGHLSRRLKTDERQRVTRRLRDLRNYLAHGRAIDATAAAEMDSFIRSVAKAFPCG